MKLIVNWHDGEGGFLCSSSKEFHPLSCFEFYLRKSNSNGSSYCSILIVLLTSQLKSPIFCYWTISFISYLNIPVCPTQQIYSVISEGSLGFHSPLALINTVQLAEHNGIHIVE